jgi:Reverse transcriptase (RNA-dependent DNA polymerase)
MTLAIHHSHTYKQWSVVHNFLIEKTPGLPRIDKLRVIHLYKADWSLIQKFFAAYKINSMASTNNTAPIEQAGGRPGRSAIELAASRMMTYETIRLQRLSGAVVYNDAKACYDRVIENLSNLALMKQGLPVEIAKLHSNTFHRIQYYIKHKLGIGAVPHSHNNPKQVHGVGQGSTDAPARWGFVCDPLLQLYKELASDAKITSPISNKSTNNKIAGFVDDTTTLMIQHYSIMIYIILILQKDTQTWERLLHTSGGKLEIPKSVFAIFEWAFDQWGRPKLLTSSSNHLHIQCSDTKQQSIIPQMSTKEAYKYVGVQLALDGNMTQQTRDLQTKCNEMSSILTQTYFNAKDADQGFTTVFTPSIKYVLPVTSIEPTKLNKIQQTTINAVLPRLGYNKHMPRAVVFATKSRGGLGILNLSTEQGTSQIQLLIAHIRAKKYLYNTIIILLETFQLLAGLSASPLIDSSPRLYVDSPWIQSVQHFLQSINGTIYVPEPTNITKNRVNDKPIMNPEISTFTKSDMECINACRFFLQVTYLSEISNDQGNMILKEAIKGTVDKNGKPLLWEISFSNMVWPRQPRPSTASWNKWKKYLQQITHPNFHIQPPLGDWTTTAHKQRTWLYNRKDNMIYRTVQDRKVAYIEKNSRTRTRTYIRNTQQLPPLRDTLLTPIVPQSQTIDKITCTNIQQSVIEDHMIQTHQPTLKFQTAILNNTLLSQGAYSQAGSTVTITYHFNIANRKYTTNALIIINDTPVAITTFQIPDHRHNTDLTHHAYGCIVPILWCTDELIRL